MYAVVETGGKQYTVKKDTVLKVEKLDKEIGETFSFERVLLLNDGENSHFGKPYLSGASVSATVVDEARDKKIIVLKFKRRKQYLKRQGHRQAYTKIKILDIVPKAV